MGHTRVKREQPCAEAKPVGLELVEEMLNKNEKKSQKTALFDLLCASSHGVHVLDALCVNDGNQEKYPALAHPVFFALYSLLVAFRSTGAAVSKKPNNCSPRITSCHGLGGETRKS